MQTLATFAALAKTLPVNPATFPAQVVSAVLSTNPARTFVYGIADSGSAQAYYYYDARQGQLAGYNMVAVPKPLPVSVLPPTLLGADRPVPHGRPAPTTWRSTRIPWPPSIAAAMPSILKTALSTLKSHGFRKYIHYIHGLLANHAGGADRAAGPVHPGCRKPTGAAELFDSRKHRRRATLNAAADTLYTVSDSGVMIFPVGRLNQQHRLAASVRDVVASGTFCDRSVITQTVAITDPGGGNTDFQLSTSTQGVTISPSSGMTPAVVQVRVDPTVFQNQNGTLA